MNPDPRHYWTEQMEAAHAFMERLLVYPLVECGEPMVSLAAAAADAGVTLDLPQELKLGTLPRLFFLRRSVAERLIAAAAEFRRGNWLLRVEDAYRSRQTQTAGTTCDFIVREVLRLARWELGGEQPSVEFVARRIAVLTATTPKFANHLSGAAVDLSLKDARTGMDVDRGGRYLEMSERTPMDSPFIPATAHANRDRINAVLAEHGFLPYPYEFWHYSHGDADYELLRRSGGPGRFGPLDFDPQTGIFEPVTDVNASLLPMAELRRQVARLVRGKG